FSLQASKLSCPVSAFCFTLKFSSSSTSPPQFFMSCSIVSRLVPSSTCTIDTSSDLGTFQPPAAFSTTVLPDCIHIGLIVQRVDFASDISLRSHSTTGTPTPV